MTNKPSDNDSVNMIETSDSQDPKMDSLPFMDTFYALSSDDSYERSLAASSLLRHLFSKVNFKQSNDSDNHNRKIALIKDGHYALTRLLKGLCSGRASARQGYASCLSTFLELSFTLGPVVSEDDDESESKSDETTTTKCWMEYYMENEDASSGKNSNGADVSLSEFVRKQLMKHTVESASGDKAGKRKGSGGAEERDRLYGKLFGILAVVKSGTLFLDTSSVTIKLMKQYMLDLLSLYDHKKWFHEASIHALMQLVSAIHEHAGLETLTHLVNGVLPSFFNGKHQAWTAEKIALYLHLQTIYMNAKLNGSDVVLPKTLKSPLLTSSSLTGGTGSILEALKVTSAVVHPRCHLVWNTIWSYLTLPAIDHRKLREDLLVGNESPKDILKSLVNGVIIVSLLATTPQEHNSMDGTTGDEEMAVVTTGANKSTKERKSLALSLIHQLCCKLHLSGDVLEQVVLQPIIVTKLFVNSLISSNKNTMGPLATFVLNEIIESMTGASDSVEDDVIDRRFGVVKALIKANPEFDLVSHTDAVTILLGLKQKQDDHAVDGKMDELWESYLSFLTGQILTRNSSPETTKKYIGLMFSLANYVFRLESTERRETIFRSVLSLLMVGGFFDLTKLQREEQREDKMNDDTSDEYKFLAVAGEIQKQLLKEGEADPAFPYIVRVSMSSRFFSLLSEAISATPAQHLMDRGQALKDNNMKYNLKLFDFVRMGWSALEKNGALPFEKTRGNDGDEEFSIVSTRKEGDNIYRLLETVDDAEEKTPKMRAISGIVCLATALIIQLLNPGSPESSEENNWEVSDEDGNDDTAEEVQELVSELSHIAETLNGNQRAVNPDEEDDDDDDSNKLASLAAVCVEILNRKLNSSAKLIRFLTKTAWAGCVAVTNEKLSMDAFILDKDVMNILLPSVCGSAFISLEDENDADSDTTEEEDDDDEVFGFSANATPMDLDNVCNSSDENEVKSEAGDDQSEEEEEDVELDPSALENLLLEDSDGEEVELEHHAGADSALAQLIKMKQDARKAGKDQREKAEGVHKLRCMTLLETVFIRKPSQQVVMMSIRPLLRARRELDKSIESITASGKKKGTTSLSEKRALLRQISALLQEKISKYDVTAEDCESLASEVMDDLKKCNSQSHRTCCSALLIMMLKAQNFDEGTILCQKVFAGTVEEWSTRRTTKIHSSMFVDLIGKVPCLSRVVLLKPLVSSAKNARSSFLKLESFRMISSLYTIPIKASNEENSAEIRALGKSIPEIAIAIAAALTDTVFSKSNKARDVLKTAEKIVAYCQNRGGNELWSDVAVMKESLELFSNKTESAGIKNVCAKLQKDISKGIDAVAKSDKDVSKTPQSKKAKKKSKKVKKKSNN